MNGMIASFVIVYGPAAVFALATFWIALAGNSRNASRLRRDRQRQVVLERNARPARPLRRG